MEQAKIRVPIVRVVLAPVIGGLVRGVLPLQELVALMVVVFLMRVLVPRGLGGVMEGVDSGSGGGRRRGLISIFYLSVYSQQ